jgi:membrane protein
MQPLELRAGFAYCEGMARPRGEKASTRAATTPDPDDPRKPDELSEIAGPSWLYVLRKTAREFITDQCPDLAASLTYYGVLAVFPALLAFVSLVGLFGDPQETTDALLGVLGGLVPDTTLTAIKEPIAQLAQSPAAGFTFVVGVGGALWSASGYVAAFARAMNRIYAIEEGRPFWKLRPITLAVTVLAIVVALIAAFVITVSGAIAEQIGDVLGWGSTALFVWNIARWPILALLAVIIVAVLYYATPNVQQPKFRWMSIGALFGLTVWVLASAGFAFYVSNFASYNQTYGAIGGVIVFLLWVWISNIALLFGAELDVELERARQLQAGIKAEETIQLPPRDTRQSEKATEQHEKDLAIGRELRRNATGNPSDAEKQAEKKAEKQAEEKAEKQATEKVAESDPVDRAKKATHLKKTLKRLRRTNRLQAAQFRLQKPGK